MAETESDDDYIIQGSVTIPLNNYINNFPVLQSAVKDTLTGIPSSSYFKIGDRTYNANLLADLLVTTQDLRDPATGKQMDPETLQAISNAVEQDDILKQRILSCTQGRRPKSTVTSSTKYYSEMIEALGAQILAACELEGITNIEEFSPTFLDLWKKLVTNFCGLFKCNPIAAAKSARTLQKMFDDAWAVVNDETDDYVHEPMVLGPANNSIQNLVKTVLICVQKDNSGDGVMVLWHLRPQLLGSGDSVWNRLLRGVAIEGLLLPLA